MLPTSIGIEAGLLRPCSAKRLKVQHRHSGANLVKDAGSVPTLTRGHHHGPVELVDCDFDFGCRCVAVLDALEGRVIEAALPGGGGFSCHIVSMWRCLLMEGASGGVEISLSSLKGHTSRGNITNDGGTGYCPVGVCCCGLGWKLSR